MKWSIAEVVGIREETPTARTLMLRIPDWPGALAGQHIDIRLTAPDGYQAARSYSLSSAAGEPVVSVSVELMPDGEVSPYLVRGVSVGDQLEVIGPLGGWFVWRPTGRAPEGWAGALGRIDAARVTAWAEGTEGTAGAPGAATYICGPTPFVELASNALVAAGADPTTVRTERFGG